MDRNKLAILTNELGGYDEVERVLGLDSVLLQRAIEGQPLTDREKADVETAYNQLVYHPEIATDNNINLDELNYYAAGVQSLYSGLQAHGHIFADRFLTGIAEANTTSTEPLELADLDGLDYLVNNLNAGSRQLDKILEVLEWGDNEAFNAMLNALDLDAAQGVPFWDIEDSEFWEWYREYFYGEE